MIWMGRVIVSRMGIVALLALPFGLRMGSTSAASETVSQSAATAPDAFTSTVRPILASKCTPCHEPGGKMYGSLPFDKSETIASHREGVLKRLKGDDRAAVEKWLASLPQTRAPAK
jgi:hypothetical protein